jgi:hypothetical protein
MAFFKMKKAVARKSFNRCSDQKTGQPAKCNSSSRSSLKKLKTGSAPSVQAGFHPLNATELWRTYGLGQARKLKKTFFLSFLHPPASFDGSGQANS